MAIMGLQKNYREAAEAMASKVKDAVLTEGEERGLPTVTVEGIFEVFDRMEMDMWGGNMRFEFRGRNEPAEYDEAYYALVGRVASASPALAGIMTSEATMQAFKEVRIKTETQTWVDGRRERETKTEERTEWRDVTEEFAKRLNPSYGAGW